MFDPGRISSIQIGQAELLKEGKDFTIIALGSMTAPSLEAIASLEKEGLRGGLINARFAKPLDIKLFGDIASKVKFIFTAEEGIIEGGFGSTVRDAIGAKVINIGLPSGFISQGKREILLEKYGLTAPGIAAKIKSIIWPR